MTAYDFDMVVIGSGPAGQRAAIQAAKLNKRVALVENKSVIGGVSINVGTIPSKTLREAVLDLSGYRQRDLYGASYKVKDNISAEDLLFRVDHVINHERDVTHHQIQRNNVELIAAKASLQGQNSVRFEYVDGSGKKDVSAEFIVIATGTVASKGDEIDFIEGKIFTSDEILSLDQIPKSLAVIGGGVIGMEYASIFATLGVRVTVIDMRPSLLTFVDTEIVEALMYHLRQLRLSFRLGENVDAVEAFDDSLGEHVRIRLASGKQIVVEKALYSIGRTGTADSLNLSSINVSPDSRGRIKVNKNYQTKVSNIYAVGDVIGFPSLASTSMEQGRLAAAHAFQVEANSIPELFPYGIYTIPEISMVGKTEQQLTDEGIPYQDGVAHYREVAKGQIIGDSIGLLKIIFHLETRKLLGIHIIGDGASELIHIGQSVLTFNGTVDYFINTVFNYPTLAEAYKIAAFDGINRMQ